MSNATVVKAWKDGGSAYLAVRLDDVEYIGKVELIELAGKPLAQQKAALVTAVKAARDAQASSETALLGISGMVAI